MPLCRSASVASFHSSAAHGESVMPQWPTTVAAPGRPGQNIVASSPSYLASGPLRRLTKDCRSLQDLDDSSHQPMISNTVTSYSDLISFPFLQYGTQHNLLSFPCLCFCQPTAYTYHNSWWSFPCDHTGLLIRL